MYHVPQARVGLQGMAAAQQSGAVKAGNAAVPGMVPHPHRAGPLAVPQRIHPDFYRALTPMTPPLLAPTQVPNASAGTAAVIPTVSSVCSDSAGVSTAILEAAGKQVTEFLAQGDEFWSFIG